MPPSWQQLPNEQQPPWPGYAPPPPPPPGAGSQWGPYSSGIEPNIVAGLSYLIGVFAFIFLFLEKQNRFARFHIIQALLLRGAFIILGVVWLIAFYAISIALISSPDYYNDTPGSAIGPGISLLCLCYGAILLADLIATIWGIVAGFRGRMVRFPGISDLAERWAGGPVVPLIANVPLPPTN
jgi:uncharacterized membrane protein